MSEPGSESAHDDDLIFGGVHEAVAEEPGVTSGLPDGFVPRSERRKQSSGSSRRRRIAIPVVAVLIVLALLGGGAYAVKRVQAHFTVADYKGAGNGTTQVRVNAGDGAGDVAAALVKADSVKSARAFTRAAESSGKAGDIQPGLYRVPLHASGQAALTAILDPANKLVAKVTIPEGRTEAQVLAELADKTKLPLDKLQAAAANIATLAFPTGITPTSAEGFLYPATYEFDPSQSPEQVVQALTSQFTAVWTKLGVSSAAAKLQLSPYQVLIMASMIESEAKFPEDRPKIARVILNRLARDMPLGIDAVSRYGASLKGLDPGSVNYATFDSPYNTYLHKGLPPGPISNPGESSLNAAANPADGDWLYYVVMDAAGHHLFTSSDQEFEAAAQRCRDNNWGC